jgi:hypothetical protein
LLIIWWEKGQMLMWCISLSAHSAHSDIMVSQIS